MSKIQFVVSAIFLLFCNACTEEVTPTPYTYTKVFTGENSKTWKVKFLEYTVDGAVEETFTLNCDANHLYTFYANSERAFKVVAGSNKCSSDEANSITDSWSFNNASATLTMILPFFTDSSLPFIVRDARKSKLELEIFLDQENTTSYRIHFDTTDED